MHSKTVSYSEDLYSEIMDNMTDYHQTGETVCGAEDPAVITIGTGLGAERPELAGFGTVRVIDRFVNPWKSDTLLVFSNVEITAEEYADYEAFQKGE